MLASRAATPCPSITQGIGPKEWPPNGPQSTSAQIDLHIPHPQKSAKRFSNPHSAMLLSRRHSRFLTSPSSSKIANYRRKKTIHGYQSKRLGVLLVAKAMMSHPLRTLTVQPVIILLAR